MLYEVSYFQISHKIIFMNMQIKYLEEMHSWGASHVCFSPFRFLYRPIKLSFLFNPLKFQKRECKKSEVILITLQPKAWRRKSTHARTDQHHFSWSAQYSDNSVGILLSSSATQRTEPREHSTQVALLNHLFSEFLFQGAGKTPLSVEGFSHFFFFSYTPANLSHPTAPQAVSLCGSVKASFAHFPLEIPSIPILSTALSYKINKPRHRTAFFCKSIIELMPRAKSVVCVCVGGGEPVLE